MSKKIANVSKTMMTVITHPAWSAFLLSGHSHYC